MDIGRRPPRHCSPLAKRSRCDGGEYLHLRRPQTARDQGQHRRYFGQYHPVFFNYPRHRDVFHRLQGQPLGGEGVQGHSASGHFSESSADGEYGPQILQKLVGLAAGGGVAPSCGLPECLPYLYYYMRTGDGVRDYVFQGDFSAPPFGLRSK